MACPVESAVMKSTVLVAPVTALEFLGEDFLLTGEGPVLSVYSLQASPKEYASLNVLHNYRIHGIRPSRKHQFGERPFNNLISSESSVLANNKEDIIVFGGKGVRLVSFNTGGRCLKLIGPVLELQDWILDIHWLKKQPHPLLGISLAHNAVLLLDAESGDVLSFYSCVETCLLYSALMIGPNWDSLVLVGGTVFNQLVLWRPTGTKPDGKSQVERRLLGHTGVIFSLCYLQKSGWLASASDDRSVRLWSVGTLGGDAGCGEESPTCLRVLYGHQARVFCVRLASNRVFSAGEDGACLLWEWGGEGKVGHTFRGHRSGGVRALAVSEESIGCKEGWMATGGADGGVRIWRVAEEKKDYEETQTETQLDLGFKGQGCPKVVRLVGEGELNTILVCTDQGEVYLSQGDSWDVIWQGGAEFQSYCVMEITSIQVQNSDCIVWVCAVGNLNGGVQVFLVGQPGVGVLLRAGEGKVHSVLWAKGLFEGSWSWCLLASGSEGLVYRWTIKVTEDESGLHMQEETLLPFLLPPCAKRWLTAAVTLPKRKGLYLCGDRRGSLLLYNDTEENVRRNEGRTDLEKKETENKQSDHGSPLSPISTLYGVHGKQGVTSVCEYQDLCYSTGRDGSVRILTVDESVLKVRRVQRACRGMEWIEKVLFLGSDGPEVREKLLNEGIEKRMIDQGSASVAETRFVMVGFHSVHFIIWDPHRQEKLLSVACGGGHRSWAYKHPIYADTDPRAHTLRQGTLVFIKHGAVMASRSLASTETDVNGLTVKEGLHGRGISCVCHLGSLTKTGQFSELWEVFVTGGEDTTVGVLAISAKSGNVKVLSVLTDHISNVRALAAIRRRETNEKGGDDDTTSVCSLVFSAGGRAQLQCYRLLIRLDEQQGQPVCQVTQIAGHRLDEQWERKRNRHKTVKMDPETRYMSMSVVHNGTECVLLAMGCSDGAVRLFSVTESSSSVDMLWECFYHQRCVLSVATYKLEDSLDRKLLLLFSATTDGCISVWDLTAVLNSKASVSWQGPSAPFFSIPVHQSGVNALTISPRREMRQMEENVISLASGGDDGQLSLMHIKIDQKKQENGGVSLQLLAHWSVPLAHSSPLTGLCLLSPTLLVTTSPDQRLCLWSMNSDGLHPLKVLFSHTADAAGLWAWFGQEGGAWVVVCGQGLQLFQLTERKMDELHETVNRNIKEGERKKVIFPHHVSRTKHCDL
ncbi:WD repeat-containing protein 6 [Carassius gibelio]|uniref:WD repeat-containing protein 6 n=1 Tax=Carassius gibelio TaxID=101364 RepID=UPI00227829CE|nr:WD repeat-containing protein 6 [Carassius gibelio]XP_052419471.1 WD repeat-containing protein 6 [Carassius gibelio]XP_052419472.1 WD repeat-containing protein 6 [Carassius gibelio]XP_052419473.1 WD repeat-containing protein 6 [Carassius gibelio]